MRSINVQELERAIGNLEHFQSHLQTVIVNFIEGNRKYEALNQPIPEFNSYVLEALDDMHEGSEVMLSVIKGVLERL